jgi:outer membrane protein TolC
VGIRAGLLAGLLAAPLAAQEAGDTLTLTLDDALRIAEGANPVVLQAENQLGLNGAEARATWLGQILPEASFNLLSTGYGGTLTRRSTDFFGNPIENPEDDWVYNSSTQQGLRLNWTLQGLNLLNARRRLDQSRRERELGLDGARATLRADVRREYFAALQQRALLEVEEAIVEARTTDLASARRLFELARTTQVDVLNAEVALDQQRIDAQQRRRTYEQALLRLRTTIGDTELPPLRLGTSEPPLFDPTSLDEDELVGRALAGNPQALEARARVEGARLGRSEAGLYKWPSLSFTYNLSRYAQTRESDAFLDLGYDPDQKQSSFGVQLTVPFLNDYFQNRYAEAQAAVQLDNEREGQRQTELEVERSVRAGLIDLRNLHESYRLAVRSEEIAGRATQLAREEYRLGARTFQELQQSVEQEATARRTSIQARFAFVESLIALETAVGGIVGPGGPGEGGG